MDEKKKKYYWLKFRVDFFLDLRLLKLRSIAGGDTYIIIFLKLMLISIKNEGIIEYQGIFPTIVEELSYLIREEAKNIQVVLDFAISHNMIEESNNNYLIPYAANNIGSESESAERVRKHREKQKPLHCNAIETKCNTYIELDTEDDKYQELNEFLLLEQIKKDKQKSKLEELAQANRENEINEVLI